MSDPKASINGNSLSFVDPDTAYALRREQHRLTKKLDQILGAGPAPPPVRPPAPAPQEKPK